MMNGVKFKKHYLWFEEDYATEAVDVMEEALSEAGLYWDLEEA